MVHFSVVVVRSVFFSVTSTHGRLYAILLWILTFLILSVFEDYLMVDSSDTRLGFAVVKKCV